MVIEKGIMGIDMISNVGEAGCLLELVIIV